MTTFDQGRNAALAAKFGDPTDTAVPEWPELDPVAYHGLAGDLVMALEADSEGDPVGMLVDTLVAFGSTLGAGPHARVGGASHPARLNIVKVGRTSRGRKGQGWADVRQVFVRADQTFDERVVSGLASGEGLIAAVQDGDNEATGVSDKRRLVVEPEFARVLAVAQREGSTLSAVVRECWDSGNLRVMTRKQPLVATGAHVSLIGHITLEELRRRLTETEAANGFANRFLFICVTRSKLLPSGPSPDTERLNHLGAALRDSLQQARRVGTVRRTPAAEERWTALYKQMADDDTGGLVGAITARAEAQCLRLSVLYALVDGSSVIDLPHLEAAWALWKYAEASAAYIFGDTLGDEIADKLLASLRRAGEAGLTLTEQSDVFKRHAPSGRLDAARKLLLGQGLIVSGSRDTDGRTAQVHYARGFGS